MAFVSQWTPEAEARILSAERERDKAEEKAAAFAERLHSVEQVVLEQQDAIEEMHAAWLIAKGGGGLGACTEEVGYLVAEVERLPREMTKTTELDDNCREEFELLALRTRQAEGRADGLEHKIEELLALIEEKDRQIEALTSATAQVAAQAKRIAELERMCSDRDHKIAKLQIIASGVDAAQHEQNVLETEKNDLKQRLLDAEAKIAEMEASIRSQLTNAIHSEKETLQKCLSGQLAKEYSAFAEQFEKQYVLLRQQITGVQLSARSAEHKAAARVKEHEATIKKLEEEAAEHRLNLADIKKASPDRRLGKLSSYELHALLQKLKAAEARANAAEMRQRESDRELEMTRREADEKEEEASEALRERARAVEALEAARIAQQIQVAETSCRLAVFAQLQAERDLLHQQVNQKQFSNKDATLLRATHLGASKQCECAANARLCNPTLSLSCKAGPSIRPQQRTLGQAPRSRSTSPPRRIHGFACIPTSYMSAAQTRYSNTTETIHVAGCTTPVFTPVRHISSSPHREPREASASPSKGDMSTTAPQTPVSSRARRVSSAPSTAAAPAYAQRSPAGSHQGRWFQLPVVQSKALFN